MDGLVGERADLRFGRHQLGREGMDGVAVQGVDLEAGCCVEERRHMDDSAGAADGY